MEGKKWTGSRYLPLRLRSGQALRNVREGLGTPSSGGFGSSKASSALMTKLKARIGVFQVVPPRKLIQETWTQCPRRENTKCTEDCYFF